MTSVVSGVRGMAGAKFKLNLITSRMNSKTFKLKLTVNFNLFCIN